MRKKYKIPACCANCYWSDRKTIYYGWLHCFHFKKKVRCSSRPCILYLPETKEYREYLEKVCLS